MPRRRQAGQAQPATRRTFLGVVELGERRLADTVARAELDLCSSAQAFLKDELNIQRTRIKARALAKLATDVVAWTSFHKVQLDDDPFKAVCLKYHDEVGRAFAGAQLDAEQLHLLADTSILWAADKTDEYLWESAPRSKEDIDTLYAISANLETRMREFYEKEESDAESLAVLIWTLSS